MGGRRTPRRRGRRGTCPVRRTEARGPRQLHRGRRGRRPDRQGHRRPQIVNPVTWRSADVRPPAEDATMLIAVPDETPDLCPCLRLAGHRPPVPTPLPPPPCRPCRRRHPTRPLKRRRRPALMLGRITTALIAVCALAITGAAWQRQSAKNKPFNTIAALDPNPATSAIPTPRSATRTLSLK